ncbi:MAG: hypothetical protein U9N52_00010 [Campylobacterota bacterium]|nr:hypothetical protein [Campylobacterota bacterium]
MKTRLLLLLLALHVSLFAAVGSWEADPQLSIKANGELNPQEQQMVLGFVEEVKFLDIKKDMSFELDGGKGTWKKVLGNSYLLEIEGQALNVVLKDETHLELALNMGAGPALIIAYVPKGSVVKAERILPKDFPYYDQAYRSELSMGEGKHSFVKLSKEGVLYEYYGSSEQTIDPALITNKVTEFSGELPNLALDMQRGTITLSEDRAHLVVEKAMQGKTSFILASFKDPSITPSTTNPWTKEAIKAYTLKHPSLTYHRKGFDVFENQKIDDEITYSITDYNKKFFDEPIGSMYKLSSKEEDGGLYRWSQFSPFVPNHVPKKRADKIVHSIEGIQEITTPAGTFTCTILNLDADGEIIKAWMINDRPGVYAKYMNMTASFTLVK